MTDRIRVAPTLFAAGVLMGLATQVGRAAPPAPTTPLSLEMIMADPDWIGPAVHGEYWGADGRSVYYSVKRAASPLTDLHRIELAKGTDLVVDATLMANADGPPVYDAPRHRAAFIRNGDVFVRDLRSNRLTQLTRTPQAESSPQYSASGTLSFRADNDWYVYDERAGVVAPAAILKTEKDPDAEPAKPDDLRDMQLRTFATLKRLHDDARTLRQTDIEDRKADATRAAAPFYLGEDVVVLDTALSPDARWMLVITRAKDAETGFEGQLTRYVTESGHEEFEKERVRVGRNPPANQSLLLLDLTDHSVHPLSVEPLPGIHDDPLKAIREENGVTAKSAEPKSRPRDAAAHDEDPTLRAVLVKPIEPDGGAGAVRWSRDGHALAIQFMAIDNKDRWLATVDFDKFELRPEHRLTDAAWINSRSNDFGWLNDHATLWFESEESGYAHLYTKARDAAPRALTQGRFEVSEPQLSLDGKWFYVRANAQAPYAYDVYRVPSTGGALSRVTHLQGVGGFALDGDGRRLLVSHSSSYVPSQLALVAADGSGAVRELTDTRTPAYRSIAWLAPQIVEIPSTHFDGKIYAKLYRDPAAAGPHPAVVFVHGAGYTQDVHLKFPYYFHEQMYHNLLVSRGYVVITIDYRASEGYGHDWRTAIYRQMGTPELEDLLDAKRWLVANAGVDAHRVGIYGGSYGGFMTLMALFRAPGEFAAGAALRPVTDWMQYNHGYTSAILNDPQVDPAAYLRSSPIEYAAGLADPLLIAHGVIDDNVLFEDSMRVYQRLIELHKDNFTLAPYPLDRHGFSNADSWLDEYKRIDGLFERYLRQ